MDIVEFLTARYTEEAKRWQMIWRFQQGDKRIDGWWDLGGTLGYAVSDIIDTTRGGREVAAKRAILALHKYGGNARHPDTDSRIPVCAVCESPPLYNTPPWPPEVFLDGDGDASMWPCLTLRHQAAPYADHADYNPAWAVA